jgi:hypothetical protein
VYVTSIRLLQSICGRVNARSWHDLAMCWSATSESKRVSQALVGLLVDTRPDACSLRTDSPWGMLLHWNVGSDTVYRDATCEWLTNEERAVGDEWRFAPVESLDGEEVR